MGVFSSWLARGLRFEGGRSNVQLNTQSDCRFGLIFPTSSKESLLRTVPHKLKTREVHCEVERFTPAIFKKVQRCEV